MNNQTESILIFSSCDESESTSETRRGLGAITKKFAVQANDVAVSTVQESLSLFLGNMDTILNSAPKVIGGLTLDEVELHVQMDAKGNFGLSSVVQAELATQSSIKLVLRKPR